MNQKVRDSSRKDTWVGVCCSFEAELAGLPIQTKERNRALLHIWSGLQPLHEPHHCVCSQTDGSRDTHGEYCLECQTSRSHSRRRTTEWCDEEREERVWHWLLLGARTTGHTDAPAMGEMAEVQASEVICPVLSVPLETSEALATCYHLGEPCWGPMGFFVFSCDCMSISSWQLSLHIASVMFAFSMLQY